MFSFESDSLFTQLRSILMASRAETRVYNEYYEGYHRLEQLGLAIPEELKRFTVSVAWPRTVVDAIEQRLNVTGFRMPGTDSADAGLWDIWQYNNMDERAGFAHTDSLALGRSYVCVGTNDEDPDYPIITVESPSEMTAIRDPRTHRVTAAMRLYGDITATSAIYDNRCTLYLPNMTRWLIQDDGDWVDEIDPDFHNLGTVPVVPMINRNRASRMNTTILEGVSEMFDVIPIADSASRSVTNLQLAQEVTAVPQKYALGMSKGDFVDSSSGEVLPVWQAYFGSVWASSNADAKIGQLEASDLSNFETTINMYSRLASGVTGLPIEYFGLTTNNPPSADGQRAGETRLIQNAERKQVSRGNDWEAVQRLVLRFRDGEWDPDARRMETLWQDAGTPTQAQVTDAVVKEYQSGLTDWETAQEELGRSPETIVRMKARRQADAQLALDSGTALAAATQASLEA